jgi:hypothetical protein
MLGRSKVSVKNFFSHCGGDNFDPRRRGSESNLLGNEFDLICAVARFETPSRSGKDCFEIRETTFDA